MSPRTTVGILVLTIVAAFPAAAGNTTDKIRLAYTYEPGVYITTQKNTGHMTIDCSLDGRQILDQTINLDFLFVCEMDISRPNPAGQRTALLTYKRIKVSMISPVVNNTFDSTDASTMNTPFAASMKALMDLELKATISGENKIVKTEGLKKFMDEMSRKDPASAEMLKKVNAKGQFLDTTIRDSIGGAQLLPERSVGTGDTWKAQRMIELAFIGETKNVMHSRLRNISNRDRGKIAVIEANGSINIDKPTTINHKGQELLLDSTNVDCKRVVQLNVTRGFAEKTQETRKGGMILTATSPANQVLITKSRFSMSNEITTKKQGSSLRTQKAVNQSKKTAAGDDDDEIRDLKHRTAVEQNRLGLQYATGDGVSRDCSEAVKWFRKAAALGYDRAQNNLGVCYDRGTGITENDEEAAKWFRKAAAQGNAEAQYNLGTCYEHGRGVKADTAEAVKWYRAAADQGNKKAKKKLESP